ncbi:beta-N-acetylglucosaminidase domain-containing protein [Mycoplasmopsis alligatoris]|uniref:F5/8 type C domain protein n=1 Tax=Mycoplasmopsis alligatoris A21JP2 TaxID=747682 RepID=D4XVB3_9BACT|nr:beta-N-acetylglucosaminidase domain-containing protein [Mycoplasmopsis alligatoris]EFF41588.1 F5/8 type C domain protein [Mycoplasmopsis alligatoris A21JP2]
MKKNKKSIILTIGSIIFAGAFPLIALSCGTTASKDNNAGNKDNNANNDVDNKDNNSNTNVETDIRKTPFDFASLEKSMSEKLTALKMLDEKNEKEKAAARKVLADKKEAEQKALLAEFFTQKDGLLEEAMKREYTINPKPQAIKYEDKAFYLTKNVDVTISEKIKDKYLENYLGETFKTRGLVKSTTANEKNTKLIIVDTENKTELEKYKADATVDFTKIDAYSLIIKEGKIVLFTKTKEGAFAGLSTLQWILEDSKNAAVRQVVINDYADTKIRGFIEGFYGVPWTWEGRQSLMKMSSKYKTNSYIFAPKDDPYHAGKWDEKYPEDQLNDIKQTVEVGHNNGVEFTWTMHPWIGKDNVIDLRNKFDEEMVKVKAKYQQLYDAGIRQFGVQADDVGNQPVELIAKMMHQLVKWGKEDGRKVKLWTFCQPKYEGTGNTWSGSAESLKEYQEKLPTEDLYMCFTGTSVLAPVTKHSTDWFKNNSSAKRQVMFWLNWPVNDPDYTAINLGPGTMLEGDVDPSSLGGVVTNPMQEFEITKVAVSAISAYTWNIKGFDAWKVWENSFKKIEPNAAEAFKQLSRHITSTKHPDGKSYWGVNINDESKHIRTEIETIKNNVSSSTNLDQTALKKLLDDMKKTQDAYEEFMNSSQNERLISELKLFGKSLNYLAKSIELGLEAYKSYKKAEAVSDPNNELKILTNLQAQYYATQAIELFDLSQHIERFDLLPGSKPVGQRKYVKPGRDYLIPLGQAIKDAVSKFLTATKLPDKSFVEEGIITGGTLTSSFDSFHENKNLTFGNDGNPKSSTWANRSGKAEDFYQLTFEQPINIFKVNLFTGNAINEDGDWFTDAKLVYSSDGKTWQDVPNGQVNRLEKGKDNNRILNININNVKALKAVALKNDNNWIALREFSVYGMLATKFDNSLFANKEVNQGVISNIENKDKVGGFIKKGNVFTYTPTKANEDITLNKNDYFGLKLDYISKIKGLTYKFNTPSKDLKVQYSHDQAVWFNLPGSTATSDKFARYVRVINQGETPLKFKVEKFELELVDQNNYSITSSDNKNDEASFSKLTVNAPTPFVSHNKTGWIQYRSSSLKEAEYNKLYLVQEPIQISNAIVTAEVYNKETKEYKEVLLGTLNKAINIFKLQNPNEYLLSWKVTYKDTGLTLLEVIKEKNNDPVKTDKLKAMLEEIKTLNLKNLSEEEKIKFELAKERASQLLKNDIGDQSEIDSVYRELKILSIKGK